MFDSFQVFADTTAIVGTFFFLQRNETRNVETYSSTWTSRHMDNGRLGLLLSSHQRNKSVIERFSEHSYVLLPEVAFVACHADVDPIFLLFPNLSVPCLVSKSPGHVAQRRLDCTPKAEGF